MSSAPHRTKRLSRFFERSQSGFSFSRTGGASIRRQVLASEGRATLTQRLDSTARGGGGARGACAQVRWDRGSRAGGSIWHRHPRGGDTTGDRACCACSPTFEDPPPRAHLRPSVAARRNTRSSNAPSFLARALRALTSASQSPNPLLTCINSAHAPSTSPLSARRWRSASAVLPV